MKYMKSAWWLFVLLLVLPLGFSVGVYDSGDYLFYTNKIEPIVDINISSGSSELRIENAVLTLGSEEFFYGDSPVFMSRLSEETFVFDLQRDISLANNARFRLLVYNNIDNNLVTPAGDPIDFYFRYDNVTPELLGMQNLIISEGKLVFEFNEPVYEVIVTINGEEFVAKNVVDNYVLDDKFVEVFVDEFSFDEEFYTINVSFSDLAGNLNSQSKDIFVSSNPLRIDLLTLQNDSSLVYNFDKRYKELFDGKIYTSSSNFELKIKTNKPANCYFSSMLFTFKELGDVNENIKQEFSTTDNLVHSFQVTDLDQRIWIACENKVMPIEVAYLDDYFGRNLIDIMVYDGDDLEIVMAEPNSLVTNNPFSIFAQTNERAVCFYNFDSDDDVMMNTSDFKYFEKLDVSLSGSHSLNFRCVDVMANDVTESYDIEIDESQGVRVTDYNPKYTMNPVTKVELSLSEVGDVDCRYSLRQVPITMFGNLSEVLGSGVVRTFTTTSLNPGENEIFIYCNKDSQVSRDTIKVTYDNKGIIISNFSFVNGKYRSENYIGSTDKIKFEFDVESLIPIDEYIVKYVLDNESYEKSFSNEEISIRGDFSNVDTITILAINDLGISKSYEKSIEYDPTPPVVSFADVSSGKKILCNDPQSGCAEVFYGFAQTNINCRTDALYGLNDSVLDVSGKNYLCVEAFNYANHRTFEIKSLGNDSPFGNSSLDDLFLDNETEISDDDLDGNESGVDDNESEDEFDLDPFEPTPDFEDDDSGANIMLIAAIIAILVAAGGGGYYAYRKGYLDKELARLGIHVPARDKKDKAGSDSKGASFTSKPIGSQTPQKNLKSSGYNSHLKKLGKFIDDKINKSSKTFDAFDEPNKGKVKGYEDSLIHGKKKKGTDLSKEDFDEFYAKSSSSGSEVKASESIEKEAESFEKYYKKKKEKLSDDDKKKNN